MVQKEPQDSSKKKIVKETFSSETISTIGDLLAGSLLSLLIIQFKSFGSLILIIPALLSLRGNLSGPFIARTSRDLIIGEFDKRSWLENILATICLALLNSMIIGGLSIFLNLLLVRVILLTIGHFILIPVLTIIFTLSISIPCSTILNLIAFKRGIDPNNLVNTIMTAIDDFFTVVCFYLTLLLLGVQ